MVMTRGYYYWPMQQLQQAMVAAGAFSNIVAAHMQQQLQLPYESGEDMKKYTIYDQTSAGPGVILWISLDPISYAMWHYLWLTVDGVEIVTNAPLTPTQNYVVGKVWEGPEEHNSYHFEMVFFETGFKLEAAKQLWAQLSQYNCYWYELDWA